MNPECPLAVQMTGIIKKFPRVLANDRVNLKIAKGEIHALIGENGAGKSTLMKILYGMLHPDEGTVRVFGNLVHFKSPLDAIAFGVGMVHQHFMLVPPLTVAENIVLGAETVKEFRISNFGFRMIDRKKAEETVENLSVQHGFKVDPRAKVEDLPVGLQQRVEILKVLYRGAKVLILDEPTAVLTPGETEEFLSTLKSLQKAGTTIVFISHKLREVRACSNRVTALRSGRVVGTRETLNTTTDELAEMMVGHGISVPSSVPGALPQDYNPPTLRLENVSLVGLSKRESLKGISFEIRPGEILGIAGVEGNGQTELVEVVAGFKYPTQGKIFLGDQEVNRWSVRRRQMEGLAHIPQDRHREGLLLQAPVWENVLLGQQRNRQFATFYWLRVGTVYWQTERLICSFDVRPPDPDAPAGALSGGNQQKLIVARELAKLPKVLIAVNPTRGVDVSATEFIHSKILQAKSLGATVLLISSELSEILTLSDRVAVIYEGSLRGLFPKERATEKILGSLMAGGSLETLGTVTK